MPSRTYYGQLIFHVATQVEQATIGVCNRKHVKHIGVVAQWHGIYFACRRPLVLSQAPPQLKDIK